MPTALRPRVTSALLLAATLLPVLTACGGGSDELRTGGNNTPAEEASSALPEEPDTSEPVTPEPPEETEPTEPPAPSEPPVPDQQLTAPGTRLEVLDEAVLPAQGPDGGQGVVSLAVTDITPAAPGQVGDAGDDPPLLVTYEVLALSGADQLAGWSPGDSLAGVTADGRFLGAIAVVGGLAECPRLEVPAGWTEGEPLRGCTLAQSPPRSPADGLAYLGDDPAYAGAPVIWEVPGA